MAAVPQTDKPQGNTGDMVVLVTSDRDSRASRRAQRDNIYSARLASALVMGSSGGSFSYLSPIGTWHLRYQTLWWQLWLRGREGASLGPCPCPSKREGFPSNSCFFSVIPFGLQINNLLWLTLPIIPFFFPIIPPTCSN